MSLNVKELVSEAVSPSRVELTIKIWSLKPNFLIFCFRSNPSSSCISSKGGWRCPAETSRALFLKFGFFQQTIPLQIRDKRPAHVKDEADEDILPDSPWGATFQNLPDDVLLGAAFPGHREEHLPDWLVFGICCHPVFTGTQWAANFGIISELPVTLIR